MVPGAAHVDAEVGGVTIPAGNQVVLMYSSANRDEDHFSDPERLDVTRSPNNHIAFGFGTHFCLGASLARLEIRVFFEELLRRTSGWRIAEGGEPVFVPNVFVRGIESDASSSTGSPEGTGHPALEAVGRYVVDRRARGRRRSGPRSPRRGTALCLHRRGHLQRLGERLDQSGDGVSGQTGAACLVITEMPEVMPGRSVFFSVDASPQSGSRATPGGSSRSQTGTLAWGFAEGSRSATSWIGHDAGGCGVRRPGRLQLVGRHLFDPEHSPPGQHQHHVEHRRHGHHLVRRGPRGVPGGHGHDPAPGHGARRRPGLHALRVRPGQQSGRSTCYTTCAQAWPPLVLPARVSKAPAGPGVQAALLGTTRRSDGTVQVTYDKWPLYLWVVDSAPGQATGQNINNLGGKWYVIAPDGKAITKSP